MRVKLLNSDLKKNFFGHRVRFSSSKNDILSGKSSSAKNDKKYKKQVRGDHFKTKKSCLVCGDSGKYKCVVCGASYCKIRCKTTHEETRCIKWNA